MIRLLKVQGNSLYPSYREGDFVIAVKIPLLAFRLRPKDVVVFRHPELGTLIKQVDHLSPDGKSVFVTGTHPFSVDSRQFGWVPIGDVIGKVIIKVRNQGRG